jgi:hypothetical protein
LPKTNTASPKIYFAKKIEPRLDNEPGGDHRRLRGTTAEINSEFCMIHSSSAVVATASLAHGSPLFAGEYYIAMRKFF